MTDQDAMDKSDRSTVATTKRSSQKKKKKTKEPPGCLGKKQQLENTSSDTYHGSTKKTFLTRLFLPHLPQGKGTVCSWTSAQTAALMFYWGQR